MLTAKDIEVGQRWRSKATTLVAKISEMDDRTVLLRPESGAHMPSSFGFARWETKEVLLADWERVDVDG